MQKPPANLSGGDRDASWSNKGYFSMLLLPVVDHAVLFTYVNTGDPGNTLDSPLYERSSLLVQVQQGLLDCMPVQLAFSGAPQEITLYLLDDAALSLSKYKQKIF
jgi:hypothetical protein